MATRDVVTTLLLTIVFLIFLESINFEGQNLKKDEEIKDFGNLNIKY